MELVWSILHCLSILSESIFKFLNELLISPLFKNLIIPLFLLIVGSHLIRKSIEKYKHLNAIELQAQSFYRERSTGEIDEMLSTWSNILFEPTSVEDEAFENEYQKLLKNTFVYGSEKTIDLIASYQQFIYGESYDEPFEGTNVNKRNIYTMVYIALIASSIKEDYTNQKISPETILKIKINDYPQFEKYVSEVKDDIFKNKMV